MRNVLLASLITIAALTGCATASDSTTRAEKRIFASWQGVSADQFVGYWGAPTGHYERDGMQIISYGYSQCLREIVVKDGVIAGGESHGSGCCVMTIAGYCKGLLNPKR